MRNGSERFYAHARPKAIFPALIITQTCSVTVNIFPIFECPSLDYNIMSITKANPNPDAGYILILIRDDWTDEIITLSQSICTQASFGRATGREGFFLPTLLLTS
jgi:hypothetical protein